MARTVVATLPFSWWRDSLGKTRPGDGNSEAASVAQKFAAHVEWAARLLPFEAKCLPRAMALSWILRSRRIKHAVVFAVRPPSRRNSDDQLHAWVEVNSEIILGDLPGPWVETLRLGDKPLWAK
ncbi:lasso peptide biosynthesis B2 protein [Sphingomonas sp. HDW15A]|nr:lasso peptide biosynthesis B2 protein [Sphingomonas sp. HDW15A]